jgi:hypothetical protein
MLEAQELMYGTMPCTCQPLSSVNDTVYTKAELLHLLSFPQSEMEPEDKC